MLVDTGPLHELKNTAALGGESCRAVSSERVTTWPRPSIKSEIYCGDDRVGFVVEGDETPSRAVAADVDPATFDRVSQYLRTNEAVVCESPRIVELGGVSLWAFACRDIVDSWPNLALVRSSADA